MSTNLYYEPAVDRKKYLGKDIKRVIAPYIWDHDGTLGGSSEYIGKDTTFWKEGEGSVVMYDFLLGLSKGSGEIAKEAGKMVDLIDKHEGIFVSLIT